MARHKLRSQGKVIERCRALREEVSAALARLPEAAGEPGVVDGVWRGEALGTLLWALQLAELPPYDQPFDSRAVAEVDPAEGSLRGPEDVELELESARLWHWRARTAGLQADGSLELPSRYATFDQLIAAVAMRGYEQGLLPSPLRGDFHAYGKVYRHLTPGQLAQAHSLAAERHQALGWLCDPGPDWDDVPLDT